MAPRDYIFISLVSFLSDSGSFLLMRQWKIKGSDGSARAAAESEAFRGEGITDPLKDGSREGGRGIRRMRGEALCHNELKLRHKFSHLCSDQI